MTEQQLERVPKSVFAVIHFNRTGEWYELVGLCVFSTKEKAKKHLGSIKQGYQEVYNIWELEIDKPYKKRK